MIASVCFLFQAKPIHETTELSQNKLGLITHFTGDSQHISHKCKFCGLTMISQCTKFCWYQVFRIISIKWGMAAVFHG